MARKLELSIKGMHCASCEVIIERKLKEVPGVDRVSVNHITGKVKLHYNAEPDINAINQVLKGTDYSIAESSSGTKGVSYKIKRDHYEAGAIFIILLGAYFFLKQANIIPDIGITDNM